MRETARDEFDLALRVWIANTSFRSRIKIVGQAAAEPARLHESFTQRRQKAVARIFFVLLTGIPSKTKGVLISLRGQRITFGPQTNDKPKLPTKLGRIILFLLLPNIYKTKGVFANRLRPGGLCRTQIVIGLDGLSRSKLVFGLRLNGLSRSQIVLAQISSWNFSFRSSYSLHESFAL
jgi:hypothetical protein